MIILCLLRISWQLNVKQKDGYILGLVGEHTMTIERRVAGGDVA